MPTILWQDLLTTLGGTAILVAALAWLSKSLLSSLLSKDIEKFKSDLQAASQKSIESFKADLQIEAQRRAVEFSTLHAKRADLVAAIYSRIVTIWSGVMSLSRELGAREHRAEVYAKSDRASTEPWHIEPGIHTLSESEEAKAKALHQAYLDFMLFYRERKIYLSAEICSAIESYVSLAGYAGVMYQNIAIRDDDNQPYVNPLVLGAWEKAGEQIPHLQALLEHEFRALLGVTGGKA